MMRISKLIAMAVCWAVLGVVAISPERSLADEGDGRSSASSRPTASNVKYARNLAKWEKMTESRRGELRDARALYEALPPERREALRRRYRWYKQLPDEERRLVRENFDLVTAASREELATLKQLYRRYVALPVEKRAKVDAFYDQWRQSSVDRRRAFLRSIRKAESWEEIRRIGREWLDREALRGIVENIDNLPPGRREELKRRLRWYKGLPDSERTLVRENIELAIAATREELAALKRLHVEYRKLPAEQQEEIEWFFRQWRKRTVDDQRVFLRRVSKGSNYEETADIARRWLRETKPVAVEKKGKPTTMSSTQRT